jgi:hypothetical protein
MLAKSSSLSGYRRVLFLTLAVGAVTAGAFFRQRLSRVCVSSRLGGPGCCEYKGRHRDHE